MSCELASRTEASMAVGNRSTPKERTVIQHASRLQPIYDCVDFPVEAVVYRRGISTGVNSWR